ncbi:MAG: MiaB/RimO family radical SAM methylthiotransferase, partial [Anaerolineales bacterium]|nr:MiaB/RimO family radical SAM methylthiotransferase [Anaerolineales bacterium]
MRIYLDSLGCRLNQSEIENYARQFRAAGHSLVPDPVDADLVVVNTCAVTAAAASDSRQKIRQASRTGAGEIVVTGCWSSHDPLTAASLPKVSRVIPNSSKEQLVPQILDIPLEDLNLNIVSRETIPGSRRRTRAFIKVQDGCDNHCTFCITTNLRGPARSRSIPEVLADINSCFNDLPDDPNNTGEIVLTGVHLGSWGQDLSPPTHLRELVETIFRRTETPRLRLSSLEPWDLDPSFFSLWDDNRLCRHLHLPLQSGCKATLRRMARKNTPESFAELVDAARNAIPDVAITTDIIVGFPGESESEFTESLTFVKRMEFSGGHVFTYSSRHGTAASRMPNHFTMTVRKERNAVMRACIGQSAIRYQRKFLGKVMTVLWENSIQTDQNSWVLNC